MQRPKLSIITVNLNNLQGLKRTVESVLSQTWKRFEYIVIDGSSVDGSKEYLSERDAEINYWISESDLGIYNAMNKGIKVANGEYMLFLNSGDELIHNGILDVIQEEISLTDLIVFNILLVDKDKENIFYYPSKLDFKFFKHGTLGHPSTFIRRQLFYTAGFYDESLKIVSDWKFFMTAVVKFNCTYKKVEEVLSRFYMDGISVRETTLLSEETDHVIISDFEDYLKLEELEVFKQRVIRSKSVKILRRIGFLKFLKVYI